MRATILAVGHKMPAWIEEGFREYTRRMPPEVRVELLEMKPGRDKEAEAEYRTVLGKKPTRANLQILNRAQAVGIARDLNLLDVTAIQTAAGTVTAFSASLVDLNLRVAIMKVAAAALVDPQDVVVFGTSAALGVVNGYAPASGDDRASVTTRIYGARVYVTESALAGNVYAFAPTGFQVFSDRLRSSSTIDPKNGGVTFGQWIHSTGPAVAIVGAAAGVDVVTP